MHWSYALNRILAAAGGQGMVMVTFTMVMEMSGVKEKVPGLSACTFLANIINVPFSVGESIPSLIAMALPEWKAYQAAVSVIILGDI